jgi:hypothetical protein
LAKHRSDIFRGHAGYGQQCCHRVA